jgi:DNA gyrase subunit A
LVKVAESEDDAAEEGDEAAANLEAGEGAAE